MAALWQGKKTMRVTKFHGESFLRVVIIGEYNAACCWPFSGTDAHPPHAINQKNSSAVCRKIATFCPAHCLTQDADDGGHYRFIIARTTQSETKAIPQNTITVNVLQSF